MSTAFFTARLAHGFEANPPSDLLYEVVTPSGERVGSATSKTACALLANSLNSNVEAWSEHIGFDAVVG